MSNTTTPDNLLYRLWGKTNERGKEKQGADWQWQMHPAICHMVDVGYVAETWLNGGVSETQDADDGTGRSRRETNKNTLPLSSIDFAFWLHISNAKH